MKVLPIEGFSTPKTIQKEPELLWAIQEMLAHDVETLLVIGTYHGGVEYHVARKYADAGKSIHITSIDPVECRQRQETANLVRELRQNWTFLHGKSTDPEIQKKLGQYDAVFIDGDHSYMGARKDADLARKVARKMIIMHDVVDSEWHRQQGCFVSHVWSDMKFWFSRHNELSGTDWAGIGIAYYV